MGPSSQTFASRSIRMGRVNVTDSIQSFWKRPGHLRASATAESVMSSTDEPQPKGVGYKNPPEHTRFRKGASGNPAGRPKGARSLKADLLDELSQRVPVTEQGERRTYSKQRIAVKAFINKAMTGDIRAATKLIELILRLLEPEEDQQSGSGLDATDEAILAAFIARQAKGNSQ